MTKNIISFQENSFNNPFDESNANNIDSKKILDLWCNPFFINGNKGMNELEYATSRLPIIVQGYRGSGKTMLLKYYSLDVQKERAQKNGITLVEQIKAEGSVGFYFRFEDSFINTFKCIFATTYKENWLGFFEHYFELLLCEKLFVYAQEIMNEQENSDEIKKAFVVKLLEECLFLKHFNITNIEDLKVFINEQLLYIGYYKNNSIFSNDKFKPPIMLDLYSISGKIIDICSTIISQFKEVVYLFIIDEFENLSIEIQKLFNTKIKFVRKSISYRIGRRNEGTATTETVNETEYLRVEHDYKLLDINNIDDINNYKKYFVEIATKRLLSSNFKCIDIKQILGVQENLDYEAKLICRNKKTHIIQILEQNPLIKENQDTINEIVEIIKNDENPIMETLNALWVVRGKDLPITNAKIAQKAMSDYINKVENKYSKKYKLDYSDKYRYSITVLIASIYKQEKMYYSFNTVLYLSEGNTRTFINICRSIISDALFYEKDTFLNEMKISPNSQSRAIHDFSDSEFESICSIINYGDSIRNLILNIGNKLSTYHKDKKLKYPETTQFYFDKSLLNSQDKKIIDTALSWAIIRKRAKIQRLSAGVREKGDLYYLNRALAPKFNISYRKRGGYNDEYLPDEISSMMKGQIISRNIKAEDKGSGANGMQISLFDWSDD